MGWATSKNGEVVYEDGTAINIATEPNEVVTLYAVWEVNTYTVVFDADLDNIEDKTQSFTNGVEQTLTANGFSKTGYHFAGWEGSNGVNYNDKEAVTFTNLENNAVITLTAVW